MRLPEEVLNDLYQQLSERGRANLDLGHGFTVEVWWTMQPNLEWPWNVFRDLCEKHLGWDAALDVERAVLWLIINAQ